MSKHIPSCFWKRKTDWLGSSGLKRCSSSSLGFFFPLPFFLRFSLPLIHLSLRARDGYGTGTGNTLNKCADSHPPLPLVRAGKKAERQMEPSDHTRCTPGKRHQRSHMSPCQLEAVVIEIVYRALPSIPILH